MFLFEISFRRLAQADSDLASDGIWRLLAAWSNAGQVLDGEPVVAARKGAYSATISCPERTSLHPKNDDRWVRKAKAYLKTCGLGSPKFSFAGTEMEGRKPDPCKRPSWYVLYTQQFCNASPLKCGDHFLPVPLYRIPPFDEPSRNYQCLRWWQTLWKMFDRTQMLCGPGERFATMQISDVRSQLAKQGRGICRAIEKVTGVPTYYYLYRDGDASLGAERRRKCPLCGRKWLLEEPLHKYIDFKCDRCRVISNIAWSARCHLRDAVKTKVSAATEGK